MRTPVKPIESVLGSAALLGLNLQSEKAFRELFPEGFFQ
jgi:hypothetical protein